MNFHDENIISMIVCDAMVKVKKKANGVWPHHRYLYMPNYKLFSRTIRLEKREAAKIILKLLVVCMLGRIIKNVVALFTATMKMIHKYLNNFPAKHFVVRSVFEIIVVKCVFRPELWFQDTNFNYLLYLDASVILLLSILSKRFEFIQVPTIEIYIENDLCHLPKMGKRKKIYFNNWIMIGDLI